MINYQIPFGIYVAHALVKVRQCISKHGQEKDHQKNFNYSLDRKNYVPNYFCYVKKNISSIIWELFIFGDKAEPIVSGSKVKVDRRLKWKCK